MSWGTRHLDADLLKLERDSIKAARVQARRNAPLWRQCLRCRDDFAPRHRHNFMCAACTKYANRGDVA